MCLTKTTEEQGGDPTTLQQPVPVLHRFHSTEMLPGVWTELPML